MFVRREGPSINVEVRVNLDGCNTQANGLEKGANTASDHPLPNTTDDTTTDQDVLDPWRPLRLLSMSDTATHLLRAPRQRMQQVTVCHTVIAYHSRKSEAKTAAAMQRTVSTLASQLASELPNSGAWLTKPQTCFSGFGG